MDETDEYKGLSERMESRDDDELLRTIEADSWAHLRATTDISEEEVRTTARHDIPSELLEASIPTREHRAVVPRPDDPRWRGAEAIVNDDSSLELPDAIAERLIPGQKVLLKVFVTDDD